MPSPYTSIVFTDAAKGITAKKLNLLRDDLSTAIGAGGGGGGTGDMTKAVYDTNNNGKVDTCDTAPPHQASHVSGADQIPSASTSVRGLMPQANGNPNAFYGSDGTQKQVAYAMLGGSQPGPVAHALSHLDNGPDAVPVATATRTGLAPKLSGNPSTFLDGTGNYSAPSGSGDMVKSVYDTNNNGKVDTCDSVPWSAVTGAPLPLVVSNLTTVSVALGSASTNQTVDCTGACSVFVSLSYTAALTLTLTHLGQNTQVFLRLTNATAGTLNIKIAGTGPTGTALSAVRCVLVSQGAEVDLVASGISLNANIIQYFQGTVYAGTQMFLMSL